MTSLYGRPATNSSVTYFVSPSFDADTSAKRCTMPMSRTPESSRSTRRSENSTAPFASFASKGSTITASAPIRSKSPVPISITFSDRNSASLPAATAAA